MSDDNTARSGRPAGKVKRALARVVRPFALVVRPVAEVARRRVVLPAGRVRVAVGVVVLAIVVFLVSGPVTLYAARSCGACHAPAYADWKASAHASVPCERCHADRAVLAGVGNSFALASDVWKDIGGAAGTASPPSNAPCVSCHPSDVLARPTVVGGLRISHKGLAEAGYRCTDCHADVAHRVSPSRLSAPTMSMCARCHNNVNVSGQCTECHSQAGSTQLAQSRDPEWSKTHGPNWRQLHGMGELSTCTMCHKSEECQQCHQVPLPHDANFIADHGATAKKSKPVCLTCHSRSFCDNCHGLPIPHPAGFLAQHSTVAKSDDDARCLRCHVADDCASCHQQHVHPHGPRIK